MYLTKQEYLARKSYNIVGPDLAWAFYERLKANPSLILAYDIETEESVGVSEESYDELKNNNITQLQFAVDKYNAIILPRFDGDYRVCAKAILDLPNPTIGFNNWSFDNPILRHHDIDVQESRSHDLMWMFHHYQPKLPRGLQAVAGLAGFPFPWKHLFGADMEMYGGADVCALHFILEWLPPIMKARGVWEGYRKFVFGFRSKLLYPAQKLGIPVNEEKRLALKDKLIKKRDQIDKELQERVPFELRNCTPRKKIKYTDPVTGLEAEHINYGYEREPKAKLTEAATLYERGCKLLEGTGRKPKSYKSFLIDKFSLVQRQFERLDKGTGKVVTETKWCQIQPFKASFDQLTRFIEWKRVDLAKEAEGLKSKGDPTWKEVKALSALYEVPRTHEGKQTTAKGELEGLAEKTGDLVLGAVGELRSLGTNITNYLPNWQPNPATGCVHTTFGFSAASGQIDSRAPNVLNVSKHTEVGQLFREIIEAPKGYVFLEADKKSFHVATMGYVANDPDYIRFSQLDPHTIFASYLAPKEWLPGGKPIELSLSNEEIKEKCKWLKGKFKEADSTLRQQAKPVVLGNQLGLGYKKLYWMNRKTIPDVERAKYYQEMLDSIFPKVKEAKLRVKQLAADQTYLMNEFGYIQWFFDVINWSWNKRGNGGMGEWEAREGDEARDAIAFAVQSPAFGMIKEEALRIEPRIEALDIPFAFRLSIHDSLIFMFPESRLEPVSTIVLEEMGKPCPRLVNDATGPQGLKVGVEYSVGRNWMKWDEKTNPEGMREIG